MMRIKKKYQALIPESKVLNMRANSPIHTYSCDMINHITKDVIPMGTLFEYDGDTVPEGYEEVKGRPLFDYSAEEQVIGQWIDGKPIYRRVLKVSASTLPASIDTGATNIDDLVTGKLQIKQSANQDASWRTVPWLYQAGGYGDASWCGGWYLGENGILYTQVGTKLADIQKYIVILEYTKTTD